MRTRSLDSDWRWHLPSLLTAHLQAWFNQLHKLFPQMQRKPISLVNLLSKDHLVNGWEHGIVKRRTKKQPRSRSTYHMRQQCVSGRTRCSSLSSSSNNHLPAHQHLLSFEVHWLHQWSSMIAERISDDNLAGNLESLYEAHQVNAWTSPSVYCSTVNGSKGTVAGNGSQQPQLTHREALVDHRCMCSRLTLRGTERPTVLCLQRDKSGITIVRLIVHLDPAHSDIILHSGLHKKTLRNKYSCKSYKNTLHFLQKYHKTIFQHQLFQRMFCNIFGQDVYSGLQSFS